MTRVGNSGLAEDIIEAYAKNPNNLDEEIKDLSINHQKALKGALEDGIVTSEEETDLKNKGFADEFVHTLAGGPNGDGGAPLQARAKLLADDVDRPLVGNDFQSRQQKGPENEGRL